MTHLEPHQPEGKHMIYDYHQIEVFIAALISSHKTNSNITVVQHGNWLLFGEPPAWFSLCHLAVHTLHSRLLATSCSFRPHAY